MVHKDLPELMEKNFLEYASYVIAERAIPDVTDGLKPVQRRILYTLSQMAAGKLHKVANVTGQTMAFHPHGDAPIYDALVNLANKEYLLIKQGNFGNIYTGDPASAARYIETKASDLARETLFNFSLTKMVPSYDSRNKEPVVFAAKIPLLLMLGADGIAVGMATKVLPHNFIELLEAEIAILEDQPFEVLPDFPTGGIMDASEYDKGAGRVKLRARMDTIDDKTIIIRDICYGTTTESLIRSVDEAAKKGKIKIDSINDYTSDKVEIEIKLPRGQYAKNLIPALFAYTECEVSLSPQCIVIKDGLPWETTVDEVLKHNVNKLKDYLKAELEMEKEALDEKIFGKSLEQLFIEKRMYKKIEELKDYEEIHKTIAKELSPYHKNLLRIPTRDDQERLLNIPIRRITKFDLEKNKKEIKALEDRLEQVLKDLKNIKKVALKYLKDLIKKYGKDYKRKTEVQAISQVNMRAIEEKEIAVGFDPKQGFIGTKVQSDVSFTCSNYDKILIMFKDGTYKVSNIPEKEFIDVKKQPVVYVGAADKQSVFNVVYSDPKTGYPYAKRFVVAKFILDKMYNYFEAGMKLLHISTMENLIVQVHFKPKPKLKVKEMVFEMNQAAVKGVSAKGIRIANKEVQKVTLPPQDAFEKN